MADAPRPRVLLPPCRTVLETARTVLVWVGALLLFYLGSGRLGEPWTLYSWLQGAG